MEVWSKVLVALMVPVAWGLVTAWLFDWLRQRREHRSARHDAASEADACSLDDMAGNTSS